MVGAMSQLDAQRAFANAQVAAINAQDRIFHLRQVGKATEQDLAFEELARAVNLLATGLKELTK
jgi:hypothetical protein